MIPTQIQTSTAVALAIAFQRYILEMYQQSGTRLSETLNSYARSVLPKRRTPSHCRRSCSLSPPRILSSNSGTRPPLPLDSNAASFYQWTMRLLLRLHVEPSTEALSHLLNATDQAENPLTTFLILELQLRQSPRPPLAMDVDACKALLDLATSGQFALAIEAFSRLSICHEVEKAKRYSCRPCKEFVEFVFCLLRSGEAETENVSFVWYLWEKWRMRWWEKNVINMKTESPGPVLEAFLGATINACIACVGDDRKHSLLQSVISSALLFVLVNQPRRQPQAIWLLENLLKTEFWVERSFPSRNNSPQIFNWWQRPLFKTLNSSALASIFLEILSIISLLK